MKLMYKSDYGRLSERRVSLFCYVCACDSNLPFVVRLVCVHVTILPVNMFLQVYSFFPYKYSGCAEVNSVRIGYLQTEVPTHANTLVFRW